MKQSLSPSLPSNFQILVDQYKAHSFWHDTLFSERYSAFFFDIKNYAGGILLDYLAFGTLFRVIEVFERIKSDLTDYEPFS